MKTSDLVGAQLDWVVAQCVGEDKFFYTEAGQPYTVNGNREWFKPSTDWAQGGPIIEREKINTDFQFERWIAGSRMKANLGIFEGSTPLIASMRCYVASKLGYEIDMAEQAERINELKWIVRKSCDELEEHRDY